MLSLLVCALLGTAEARGSDWREPWYEKDASEGSVTVSVSPLRLLERGELELGGEFRIGPTRSFGVSTLLDMGGSRLGGRQMPNRELGLQLREYVVGDFDNGLALGAQAHATNAQIVPLRVDQVRAGPFLAAKVTLAVFTVEARGGPELTFGRSIRAPNATNALNIAPWVDLRAGFTF